MPTDKCHEEKSGDLKRIYQFVKWLNRKKGHSKISIQAVFISRAKYSIRS